MFDSCYMWCISIPVAYVLSRFTDLPVLALFAICNGLELIKCVFGYILLKSGKWVTNIVQDELKQEAEK